MTLSRQELVDAYWPMYSEVILMALLDRIDHTIKIPEGVSATLVDGMATVSGPNGSISREFISGRVSLFREGDALIVRVDIPRRKEKALAGAWAAHLRNMVVGVTDGFTYHLKALYSHFPMTLAVKGNIFVVNNYFGEKVPRNAALPWASEVKVEVKNKVEITVSGPDKEKVGQTAANIERCTTVKKRDRRVFQDGIYLVKKE
jgi:large subunit ribosomal protein L6